jgi:acyl-CoA thioesterase-1
VWGRILRDATLSVLRQSASAPFRQYGEPVRSVQRFATGAIVLIACGLGIMAAIGPAAAADRPTRIVALGDSLIAGFGLDAQSAFPAQLQRALDAKGEAVEITNAGVSGDTATDGLARLDWAVPDGTDAVIIELGANDMLRGIDPKITRAALGEIVRRLGERHVPVLLVGMLAAPNMGTDYAREFNAIFPDLASRHGLVFYPFYLDGVAADHALNQPDGMHPKAAGVEVIVRRMLPTVETLVARARQQRGT